MKLLARALFVASAAAFGIVLAHFAHARHTAHIPPTAASTPAVRAGQEAGVQVAAASTSTLPAYLAIALALASAALAGWAAWRGWIRWRGRRRQSPSGPVVAQLALPSAPSEPADLDELLDQALGVDR